MMIPIIYSPATYCFVHFAAEAVSSTDGASTAVSATGNRAAEIRGQDPERDF